MTPAGGVIKHYWAYCGPGSAQGSYGPGAVPSHRPPRAPWSRSRLSRPALSSTGSQGSAGPVRPGRGAAAGGRLLQHLQAPSAQQRCRRQVTASLLPRGGPGPRASTAAFMRKHTSLRPVSTSSILFILFSEENAVNLCPINSVTASDL